MENLNQTTSTIVEELVLKNWDDTVDLLIKLVKSFPIYNNEIGQIKCQSLIREFLLKNEIEFRKITYKNSAFSEHPLYVNVEEFGEIYINDKDRKKNNIIAFVKGHKPGKTIILNAHYDVDGINNPDKWAKQNGWKSGEIKSNFLYGRGATDMLGGLCSLLLILKSLNILRNLWEGNVIFAAVCDEEIGGNGTLQSLLWLKENKFINNQTYALIAEPSDRLVCEESLGFFHIKLQLNAKSMHMGVAREENNALYKFIKIVSEFDNIIANIANEIDLDQNEVDKIKHNWGIISGGNDAAIPLSELLVEGVIFLPESINSKKFKQLLKKFIKKISNETVIVEFSTFEFQGARSEYNPLANLLTEHDAFLKEEQISKGLFPSPCDARLFKSFKIPVIIYGPGSLSLAHSYNERIYLPDMQQYVKHTLFSILNFLKYD